MEKQKSSTKKSVEVLELSRQLKEFVQRLSRRVYQEGEERQQQEGETSSLLLFFSSSNG